jgi:hypothetical protein
MNYDDPLTKSKEQYADIIKKIESEKSAVGIDAQYTHAIILDYLQQITQRLDVLERN